MNDKINETKMLMELTDIADRYPKLPESDYMVLAFLKQVQINNYDIIRFKIKSTNIGEAYRQAVDEATKVFLHRFSQHEIDNYLIVEVLNIPDERRG